jgi:4-oxalocrotonate tautomerase
MPLIDVRLLEGVFSPEERSDLAEGLIDAVVAVKGESFRTETEVLITEVPVGNWYERGTPIVPERVGATGGDRR